MSREPRTSPILPAYGEFTLSDLATSLLASLSVEHAANPLGLPPVRQACLLIVDGLGWEQLRGHQAAAPFLSELAFNSRPLTCGFPSTTVTSMASLGTGLTPGEHGLLGLRIAIPGTGALLNGLHWPEDVDPRDWQPRATIYDRAAAAGVWVAHVASGRYESSGLSRATLRGAAYRPAWSLGALGAEAVTALHEAKRTLVSVYTPDLDAAGHQYGVGSAAWTYQLAYVDKLAEQVAAALPMGAVLYVTGDHGMVNVCPDDRIDVESVPQLREGVALLGGEPRARHVYARDDAAADVLAAWRDELGDRAWVASRDEAIKDGWFGPVDESMRARIGDVVAAATGSWAMMAPVAESSDPPMAGMHGSLTAAEQLVPLLAFLSR
ncbi:MAG TPA: alkaline phosphatase family protein [Trebonia sp.]|nr:alkaline phosphatase family protein [Trebonia sp.]